jgi:hypothetical protein
MRLYAVATGTSMHDFTYQWCLQCSPRPTAKLVAMEKLQWPALLSSAGVE